MSTELLIGGQGSATGVRLARAAAWLRRHRLWLIAAATLAVAALAADQWQQQRELDQLVALAGEGESAVGAVDVRVQGVVIFYTPAISAASRTAGLEASFAGAVSEAVTEAAAGGAEIAERLDEVRVLPWHRDVRVARTTYRERIEDWRTYLTTISSDPGALYGSQSDLDDSAAAARAALVAAIPWSAPADREERIAATFR